MLSEDMPKGVAHSDCDTGQKSSVSSWIIFCLVILTGLFFAYFNNRFVAGGLKTWKADLLNQSDNNKLTGDLLVKEKFTANGAEERVVWLKGAESSVPFVIAEPQTVRMRMRAYFPSLAYGSATLTVSVNGRDAQTLIPGWNGGFAKYDLNIHKKFFKSGENVLGFRVGGSMNQKIGLDYINLRNYAGISNRFPKALVYYDGNYPDRAAFAMPYDYLLYPAVIFVVWILTANLVRVSRGYPLRETLKKSFYVYIPPAAVFLISTVYSKVTRYTLSCDPETFFILAGALAGAFIVYHAVLAAWVAVPDLWQQYTLASFKTKIGSIKFRPAASSAGPLTALRFIGTHAATTAVAVFMVCLIVAGVSMILKRQDIAERMADVAYFSLVFGVLLRIFDLKRDG
ncbi:MAG: hypothetical protein HY889_00885 [Deltaproteobacteria bacterium]|nr:hypothetical protein [Deltaproteobacteria bacterium]